MEGNQVTLAREPSCLIVSGHAGSGKTELLKSLAVGRLLDGAQVFVADVSRGLVDYESVKPWLSGVAATRAELRAMLQQLGDQKVARTELNRQHGVDHAWELPESVRPSEIYLIVDEFGIIADIAALVPGQNETKPIMNAIAELAKGAASAGIHLVLAAQKVPASSLNRLGLHQSLLQDSDRVLLGKATFGQGQSAFRNPEDAPDPGEAVPAGRGVFEPIDGPARAFQGLPRTTTARYTQYLAV